MLVKFYFVFFGFMSIVAGEGLLSQQNDTFGCGPAPTISEFNISDFKALSKEIAIKEKQLHERSDANVESIVIDTYVHIIRNSKTAKEQERGGPWRAFRQLIQTLNDDFAASGISFRFSGYDYTTNDQWAKNEDAGSMTKQLRKGDYSALNLYYVDSIAGSTFWKKINGYCYYPASGFAQSSPSTYSFDGCVMRIDTAPNGRTTTHEIGHWLGLMHTFEGGCYGDGDMVDDTPPHYSPTYVCLPWIDSCWFSSGSDPVKNHMNYLPDWCRTEFTPGQTLRMRTMWSQLRKPSA